MTILAHVSMQAAFKLSSRREEADSLFQTNGFQDMPVVRSISALKDDGCLSGTGMCDCRIYRDLSSGKRFAQMSMGEIEKIIRAGKVVV